MPRSRLLFALVLTLLLSACGNGEGLAHVHRLPTDAEVEQYNASVPAEDHIVCRMETSVKSHIPRRVCRRVQDIAESSAFHREQLRRVLQ